MPAVIIAAALLAAPAGARAEAWSGTVPVKARALADRGRAFHEAGEYAKAIAAFTQAYAMAPSPGLLFNLAQAYRMQGNCDDAALMYRRYLATKPSPEKRAVAGAQLTKVERCLRNKLSLNIPIDTDLTRLGVPPAPAALTTTATAPAPSAKAQIEKDVGLGLGLGGSVALAAAMYYAVSARDAANDVAAAYARHATWQDIAPLDARGRSSARDAQILGIGGGIGVASGILIYVIGKHSDPPPVTVAPTGHGVEASILWAF